MTTLTDTPEPLIIQVGQVFQHHFPELERGSKVELVKLEYATSSPVKTVVSQGITTVDGFLTLKALDLSGSFVPTLNVNNGGKSLTVDYVLKLPQREVKVALLGPPYYITREFHTKADSTSIGNTLLGLLLLIPFVGAIFAGSLLEASKSGNLIYDVTALLSFFILMYPIINYIKKSSLSWAKIDLDVDTYGNVDVVFQFTRDKELGQVIARLCANITAHAKGEDRPRHMTFPLQETELIPAGHYKRGNKVHQQFSFPPHAPAVEMYDIFLLEGERMIHSNHIKVYKSLRKNDRLLHSSGGLTRTVAHGPSQDVE